MMDILKFARELENLVYENDALRREVERLRKVEEEYTNYLNTKIKSDEQFFGNVLITMIENVNKKL